MNRARKKAMKDISEHLKEGTIQTNFGTDIEIWVVTPTNMYNKQTLFLNRELGIHKLNKSK